MGITKFIYAVRLRCISTICSIETDAEERSMNRKASPGVFSSNGKSDDADPTFEALKYHIFDASSEN